MEEAHFEAVAGQEQAGGAKPPLEDLRTLLKARGWSLHLKKQRGKSYVYATRKVGRHTQSRYLAPLSNLTACISFLKNVSVKQQQKQESQHPVWNAAFLWVAKTEQ